MSPDPPAVGLERTLPREAYLSADGFEREKERIFFREWFVVGREEELAEAGWFAPDALPSIPPPFTIAHRLIVGGRD